MLELNRPAAEIMTSFPVSACTDITGFGLLGHLHEMTSASGVDAEIFSASVPLLPRAMEMAAAGIVPGGTLANRDFTEPFVKFGDNVSEPMKILLNDAQTSGGLLISVQEDCASKMLDQMSAAGIMARLIGKVRSAGKGNIDIL
jgi:selenide,water dikinase